MDDNPQHIEICGRVFQQASVEDRIYCMPTAHDEIEEGRLSAQHSIMFRLFGDALFSPLIQVENPRSVLELGYGAGDWCVQLAEEFENCKVTAVDINPFLVVDQPDNLSLYSYNLNDSLNDPEVFKIGTYDLINSRFVAPGIIRGRWQSYVRDMGALLRPGGWVQVIEYYLNIQSYNGKLTDEHAISKWWREYSQAMESMNRAPRFGPGARQAFQQLLSRASLSNVRVDTINLPVGGWNGDPQRARIGRDAVKMVGDLLESVGLWPFTQHLGWTESEFFELIEDVRKELRDETLKLYVPMWVICLGRVK